ANADSRLCSNPGSADDSSNERAADRNTTGVKLPSGSHPTGWRMCGTCARTARMRPKWTFAFARLMRARRAWGLRIAAGSGWERAAQTCAKPITRGGAACSPSSSTPSTIRSSEMTKYAIVVMSEHGEGNPGGQGRMVHALSAAQSFKDAGEDVTLWFHGVGVTWLSVFDARYDAFARHYGPLFDSLRDSMGGACS